jgi:hypothetical protein
MLSLNSSARAVFFKPNNLGHAAFEGLTANLYTNTVCE